MQNVLYRMSQTPGQIKWTGRKMGQDTHDVLAQTLEISEERITQLEKLGIIKLGNN
jgi:crotonobetainyl-CoA:carnitine CoA-transferase CaiB-like acyl-CoA transferase